MGIPIFVDKTVKIVLDGVKRHKGGLASGKTLVCPLSVQNIIHTDME